MWFWRKKPAKKHTLSGTCPKCDSRLDQATAHKCPIDDSILVATKDGPYRTAPQKPSLAEQAANRAERYENNFDKNAKKLAKVIAPLLRTMILSAADEGKLTAQIDLQELLNRGVKEAGITSNMSTKQDALLGYLIREFHGEGIKLWFSNRADRTHLAYKVIIQKRA